MKPQKIKARDLKLADVISIGCGVWHNAIVKKVTDDSVTLFRPYGTTADFSYTGGVICFVGIEEYKIDRNDYEYMVYERRELK